ncbi:MAG: glutathione S-transferase C-terminal domain-containing protein, partial [Polyangiaceae bacterium]|nr:glutathione S-transferase C-terminal domain-containing protein [Polyangiaceae bacterium]
FDVVDWLLPPQGWTMTAATAGATLDTVEGRTFLGDIYRQAEPDYQGSVTVPVLYDKSEKTIVNNESSHILRFLNSEFQEYATNKKLDLYPVELRGQIDAVNEWVYPWINNGVYRSGFARSQPAYDAAVRDVFRGLEKVESILSKNRYLLGETFTEADLRLWTTLIRFDSVYATHFKCNLKRLVDYPHTWAYTRELYSYEAFRATTNQEHIRCHYYISHESINPFRILPIGFDVNYEEPHHREALPGTPIPGIIVK